MQMIRYFSRNTKGKDYIVGDIHGSFSLLKQKLNDIGFNYTFDRLFATGDLVDKGPESYLVENWLNYDWFFSVAGNHCNYAIEYPYGEVDSTSYLKWGGEWNLKRNFKQQKRVSDLLDEKLSLLIELETSNGMIGIVHGGIKDNSWLKTKEILTGQTSSVKKKYIGFILNSRIKFDRQDTSIINGIDFVVSGHTRVKTPTLLGNNYFIDTGVPEKGSYFTILDTSTMTYL